MCSGYGCQRSRCSEQLSYLLECERLFRLKDLRTHLSIPPAVLAVLPRAPAIWYLAFHSIFDEALVDHAFNIKSLDLGICPDECDRYRL